MANSNRPESDSDFVDPLDEAGQTYELTSPSQDGMKARPSPDEKVPSKPDDAAGEEDEEIAATIDSAEVDPGGASDELPEDAVTLEHAADDDARSAGDTSQTFLSQDDDEPLGADSQTFISDEFDEPLGADSQTLVSDEFDDGGSPEARTIASDQFETPAADDDQSRTLISDEFDPAVASDAQTIQSDEFDSGSGADSRTIQSDEFDEDGPVEGTIGDVRDDQKTFVSEDLGGPVWSDTGAATMMADADGTSEDSRTVMSDSFGDDDEHGLMAQSNVQQTINPKSMDSADRKHWDEVIRGALGTQAVPVRRGKRDSSVVGVGSNLNIQTRTLVEGVPVGGAKFDYRIEKKLGEGGMGAVYLANQTSLNRNVALKVIKPISDKESQRLKQSGRLQTIRQHREGQFLSEAVVTGDLETPNIVPIYDVAATREGTVS